MEVSPTSSYRSWLIGELESRQQTNPRFSLRNFASTLGISAASLSQLMSGKRRMTPKMALRLSKRLHLGPDETHALIVQSVSDFSEDNSDSYTQLDIDKFKVISDWYHYAILSLSRVQGARASVKWIARRLGIAHRDAEQAFYRLRRLGLVKITGESFKQAGRAICTKDEPNDPAIQKYLKQFMEKSERALTSEPPENIDYSTIVMAADPAQIPEVKRQIKLFRRRMSRLLEQSQCTRVYAMSIQLFPIDKAEEKNV